MPVTQRQTSGVVLRRKRLRPGSGALGRDRDGGLGRDRERDLDGDLRFHFFISFLHDFVLVRIHTYVFTCVCYLIRTYVVCISLFFNLVETWVGSESSSARSRGSGNHPCWATPLPRSACCRGCRAVQERPRKAFRPMRRRTATPRTNAPAQRRALGYACRAPLWPHPRRTRGRVSRSEGWDGRREGPPRPRQDHWHECLSAESPRQLSSSTWTSPRTSLGSVDHDSLESTRRMLARRGGMHSSRSSC